MSEQPLTHWEFGQALLETEDLDPVYTGLTRLNLDQERISRWLLSYWCFYHSGISCKLTEDSNFWAGMEHYANMAKAPRGVERRHFRGQSAKTAVENLQIYFPSASDAVSHLIDGPRTFQDISERVQRWPMFGPWVAFKIADMIERCLRIPVDFSNCQLGIYSEPVAGAKLVASQESWPEDIGYVLDRLQEYYEDNLAPPHGDRPVNVQELETILCKFKPHFNGRYPVGKDTLEVIHSLRDYGPLALRMMGRMPVIEDGQLLRQQRFQRHAIIDREDEREYVPLAMLVGSEARITPVEKAGGIRHIKRQSAPSPRGWYKDKHTPKNVRPRPCYAEALLTTPYSGYCNIGCRFCYVNMGSRGYKATLLPTINEGYPEQLDKQLAKMQVTGAAYMSSFTEPFQKKLEDEYHITERVSNVFNSHGIPIFYLSRTIPPSWAEDDLLQNPYSYMQWSINTSNPETLRKLSPGIFDLDDFFEAIARYSRKGIYTSFQLNPLIPGVTTLEEILELVRLLRQAGGRHVIVKFFETSAGQKKIHLERLRTANLEGVDEFESLLNDFFGHQYYVQQDVRTSWLNAILKLTRELGMTMSTCYEYYRNRMSGASMAPWFTTADQCHGPAVPVYYRPEPGEGFIPLPGCYRKGCLYCDFFGPKVCNEPDLMSAKALQYKDLRNIRITHPAPGGWAELESCPPPDQAHTRGSNPDLKTDAELWGLPPMNDVLRNPSCVDESLGCTAGCTCRA